MRVGILTGGGDAPGLNAVIRAVVKAAARSSYEVLGIMNGFDGLLAEPLTSPLGPPEVRGLVRRGGTILGTSNRGNPFRSRQQTDSGSWVEVDRSGEVVANTRALGLDAIIAIGGDGTLKLSHQLWKRDLPMIAVPKTIDNDILATEATFGYDTALGVATDAIDRLQTTAEAHHRVMYLELMGRHAGWIAMGAGLAGGADVILIPELPFHIEAICNHIERRRQSGKHYTIVVVAEGATEAGGSQHFMASSGSEDSPRLGGIADWVGTQVNARNRVEYRVTVLGHLQRGGTPTPRDRILATRFGAAALGAAVDGHHGVLIALRNERVIEVPIEQAAGNFRGIPLDGDLLSTARALGVCLGEVR